MKINKLLHFVPDDLYCKIVYRRLIGESPNLRNPRTFNDKLNWLKVYYYDPSYTKMVDKFEAKKFVQDKLGGVTEHIIPTYGVWDRFDDIDFESLPDQFVLKCTHNSSGVVICEDKKTFNMLAARAKLEPLMAENYYWVRREWP